MFTQLFGSYLLNKKFITTEQLTKALEYQKTVHLKLGVIAVNYGFMTPQDVSKVHTLQSKIDKKFGELAIEMGFLDEEKLNTLLSAQKPDYLLLGQSLIEKGYMTLDEFSEALDAYKKDYSLSDEKFNLLKNENIDEIIDTFYNFNDSSQSSIYKNYLSLFVKNIVRFIDTDFKIRSITPINEYKIQWGTYQEIIGENKLHTYIATDEKTFINLAGRYVKENYVTNNEYVQASIGEFLNLVNGIYLVNMSNEDIELELTAQTLLSDHNLTNLSEAFCIPIEFSFGTINIIISR
jgi:hypothetical protein